MNTFISTKKLSESGLQDAGSVYDSGIGGINSLKLTYRPGQVILFGSRPAMGRTLFILHMFSSFWKKHQMPQAFFSNEEPEPQVYQKLVANVTGSKISEMNANQASYSTPEHEILCSDNNLFLTDFLAWETLKDVFTRLHDEKGISVFYIDKIHGLYSNKKFEGRNNEMGYIIEDMKKFALQRQLLFFVSASLNRDVDRREGKYPCMADIRDSSSLEEYTDVIMLLRRPDFYGITEDEYGNSLVGVAEILVVKNRNGETGEMIFSFKNKIPRFEENIPPVYPKMNEVQK